MVFATWADYLCGHDGADDTNEETNALGDSFDTPETALDNLRGEEATLFMGISPDGSPLFVHHLTDLGSNRRNSAPYLVGIVGLTKGATIVKLDPVECFGAIPSGNPDDDVVEDYMVPTANKLAAAGTAEGFAACKPSASKNIYLSSLCLIPLPPFLVPCVSAHAHSSFAELGTAIAAEITGTSIKDRDGKKIATTTHIARLLHFLWWAHLPSDVTGNYRLAITLLADPRPSVVKWRDNAIRGALGSTESPTGHPTSSGTPNLLTSELVGALGELRTTMDSIALKDSSPTAEGAKNFGKLPSHLQILLFRLSHVPGLPEPTKLTAEGSNFMSQATLASATSLLKTALRQKFGLSVTVQAGSVQALRTGQVIWDDPASPGNHSVFQYYAPTPGDTADSAQALAWHLTSTEGRGVEGSDIQRAMKLQPRASGSVFGCSRQILHFGSVHGFLYGEHSPVHVSLKGLAEWMLSAGAMTVLEQLASRIDRFYERFLATVDIRVQAYICSCAYVETADAVEQGLINFEPIKTNLRLQNSSDLAGTVFPSMENGERTGTKRVSEGDDATDKSKLGPLTNVNPHPTLALITYTEWDKVRKSTESLPKVDGVVVCARFHCRQCCYNACPHVHGRLSKGTLKLMEKWIAESKLAHAKEARDAAAKK
jgi:hypothetical protein